MDEHTRHNWLKIKQMLEQTGKTDSFFYKRACAAPSRRKTRPPEVNGISR